MSSDDEHNDKKAEEIFNGLGITSDSDEDKSDDDDELVLNVDYNNTDWGFEKNNCQNYEDGQIDGPVNFDFNFSPYSDKPFGKQSYDETWNCINENEYGFRESNETKVTEKDSNKKINIYSKPNFPRVTSQPLQQAQQPMNSYPKNNCFSKGEQVGWMCKPCGNFNYEKRTYCNRCGQPQIMGAYPYSPLSYTGRPCINPSMMNNIKMMNTMNVMPCNNKNIINNQMPYFSPSKSPIKFSNSTKTSPKEKKQFVEREGDWTCLKCKNLNFAFRTSCNRCYLSKGETGQNQGKANTNFQLIKKGGVDESKIDSSPKNNYYNYMNMGMK